jgi:hypothetical protein
MLAFHRIISELANYVTEFAASVILTQATMLFNFKKVDHTTFVGC